MWYKILCISNNEIFFEKLIYKYDYIYTSNKSSMYKSTDFCIGDILRVEPARNREFDIVVVTKPLSKIPGLYMCMPEALRLQKTPSL